MNDLFGIMVVVYLTVFLLFFIVHFIDPLRLLL